MLEHPLQRFFHSMRAKRPFDWVRFQRRDLLLIDHPLCQAVFSRQGAQLLHFQPQGERPLLWCASEWPALSSAPVRQYIKQPGGVDEVDNALVAGIKIQTVF